MTALILTSLAALGLGAVLPLKSLLVLFLGGVLLLFVIHFGTIALTGFGGLPASDALLLFEGQWSYYLAYSAEHALRRFAIPVILFGAVLMWRLSRKEDVV